MRSSELVQMISFLYPHLNLAFISQIGSCWQMITKEHKSLGYSDNTSNIQQSSGQPSDALGSLTELSVLVPQACLQVVLPNPAILHEHIGNSRKVFLASFLVRSLLHLTFFFSLGFQCMCQMLL